MAAHSLHSGVSADELDDVIAKARWRDNEDNPSMPVRYMLAGMVVDTFAVEVSGGRVTVHIGGEQPEPIAAAQRGRAKR